MMTSRITGCACFLAMALGTYAAAPRRIVLFNGTDLRGWHQQGNGEWRVVDGTIAARNPGRSWNHLLTDSAFGDGFLRLKFKNLSGNSGLYFHTELGGDYAVHGMQIEIARETDGSVMWVTEKAYGFVGKTTSAQRAALIKQGGWNELAVWIRGNRFTVYLNGKKALGAANVPQMAASGRFALQLHEGADNEIYFKDIEVFLPVPPRNCADSLYLEFQKELPASDPGTCPAVALAMRRPKAMDQVPDSPAWDFSGRRLKPAARIFGVRPISAK